MFGHMRMSDGLSIKSILTYLLSLFRFIYTFDAKVDFAAFYRLTQLRQCTIDLIDQLDFHGSVNSNQLQQPSIDSIDQLDRFRGLVDG